MSKQPGTIEQDTADRLIVDCPLLAEAIPGLLRHEKSTLAAYFQPVCVSSQVGQTATKLCCHYLLRDGNGEVRVKALAERLRQEVINYTIPRSRIQEAKEDLEKTNSTAKFVKLEREARHLFNDLTNTGEGGELLLYVLTESILGLPQLLCKMPLKTSTAMHYHGVDGIHGGVDSNTGNLALYWGESKLHKSMSGAVGECFKSIAPFLLAEGGSQSRERRDLELLRDNIDLNDDKLESAFRKYLDPDHPDHLKLQYRGVCLVGFDLADYANPLCPQDKRSITQEATEALESWRGKVDEHVRLEKLDSVVIETFCIPFPSVEEFRQSFLKEMELLHGT